MIAYRNLGLYGRLGNALFELAATIGIAMDHGEEPIFPENWMHRPFFSVPDEFFGPIPDDAKEATEFATHLDYRARAYLQDVNLFWPYIDVIRQYLQPSETARRVMASVGEGLLNIEGPWLCVHVRRGDNVFDPGVPNKSDYHLCPPLEYYERGIHALSPWPHGRAVFSDDIPWCKASIAARYYGEGIAHPKEHEPDFMTQVPRDWVDLFLMSTCDRFVISGSTYGIWGAILADVRPEDVVRPDKVYGPIVRAYTDESLLFPPGWRVCATGY